MLSTLTAEQKNMLQTLLSGLELAAHIAHARVTVYLLDDDKKFLQVLKQVQPLTQFGKVQPDLTGRKLRVVEEPMNLGFVEIPGIPGMRMVVFSVVLLVIILYRREGVMGMREFSWNGFFRFFSRSSKKGEKA